MSTSQFPIAELGRARFAQQSNLTTPVSGTGFYDLSFYSAAFDKARPLQDDRMLGAGYANATDSRAAGPGNVAVTGKLELPADVACIGWALTAILGAGTMTANTDGGEGDKNWAFSSGGLTVPTWTAEIMKAAALFDQVTGAYAKQVAFSFKGGDQGYAKMSVEMGGVDILDSQTSSIAGTPTVLSGIRFPASLGQVTLSGSAVGAVLDCTVTIKAEFEEDRYLGQGATIGAAVLKSLSCDLEHTVRYTGDAIRAYGEVEANGLPNPITAALALSIDDTHGLTLSLPAVRYEPMSVPIDGPGGLQVKLKGRAEQTSSLAMLTAVLLNQVVSYA